MEAILEYHSIWGAKQMVLSDYLQEPVKYCKSNPSNEFISIESGIKYLV